MSRERSVKRKLLYEETYPKNTTCNKKGVLENLEKDCIVEMLAMGKYNDGSEFMTIRIIIK